jgi:hypothetical protein
MSAAASVPALATPAAVLPATTVPAAPEVASAPPAWLAASPAGRQQQQPEHLARTFDRGLAHLDLDALHA